MKEDQNNNSRRDFLKMAAHFAHGMYSRPWNSFRLLPEMVNMQLVVRFSKQ